ncbi:hypothetical protein Z950_1978 [Sulfitobacter mediterraneus KCTC 32188]|nr:hypothetical protein Z950_1978 [Sulfitobacter mediterraneus KCTC 32188]
MCCDTVVGVGSGHVEGQVAHGVQNFNAVGACGTVATGRIRISAELVCSVLITQTGQAEVDWVHARHEFDRAVDVTNANFQTAGTCEETRAVEACACWAVAVVSVVLLHANACTKCYATVRFCGCVDLQTETACDVGFVANVCFVVQDTKAAPAAECNVCCCNAGCRNQSCCSEENFFHEFSLGLNSHAQTGESGKGMQGVCLLCPHLRKTPETPDRNVALNGAALPQFFPIAFQVGHNCSLESLISLGIAPIHMPCPDRTAWIDQ